MISSIILHDRIISIKNNAAIQSEHWKFLYFKKQSVTSALLSLQLLLLIDLSLDYACVIIEVILSVVLINLFEFLKFMQ